MQSKMSAVKTELANSEFDGDSGNGLVSVKLNGKGDLIDVTLNPAVLKEDPDLISDLIKAAFAKANLAKEEKSKQLISKLAPGLSGIGLSSLF